MIVGLLLSADTRILTHLREALLTELHCTYDQVQTQIDLTDARLL